MPVLVAYEGKTNNSRVFKTYLHFVVFFQRRYIFVSVLTNIVYHFINFVNYGYVPKVNGLTNEFSSKM